MVTIQSFRAPGIVSQKGGTVTSLQSKIVSSLDISQISPIINSGKAPKSKGFPKIYTVSSKPSSRKTKLRRRKMNKKVLSLVHAAVIAALYVVLTLLANALGLANYPIQIRFSEALTILPYFTPAAVPGLFVGCILANILTGGMPLDVVFGSLATLLGALGTWFLCGRRKAVMDTSKSQSTTTSTAQSKVHKILAPVPPIISNTLIVPFVLAYVYQFEGSIPYFMLTVGAGEVISCGILGLILLNILQKYQRYIFRE